MLTKNEELPGLAHRVGLERRQLHAGVWSDFGEMIRARSNPASGTNRPYMEVRSSKILRGI